MDIEKLIERLKGPQIYSCPIDGEYSSCTACQKQIAQEAATALSTLRPVNRGQIERMHSRWITVVEVNGKQYSKCAACQNGLDDLEDAYLFCPNCGAPMTDEAAQMVMERLEVLNDGKSD